MSKDSGIYSKLNAGRQARRIKLDRGADKENGLRKFSSQSPDWHNNLNLKQNFVQPKLKAKVVPQIKNWVKGGLANQIKAVVTQQAKDSRPLSSRLSRNSSRLNI